VKISLIHISFGRERSNRLGGCSRAGFGAFHSIRPSSCRIRRTCVSLMPSASKRASTSRILRVPYSGCSSLTSSTACFFCSAALLGFLVPPPLRFFGTSAAAPPSSYFAIHDLIAAGLGPNDSDTSATGRPCSSTASTALMRTCSG